MKTIDNLGIESSFQYARNQSLLDPELMKDSSFVSKQSQVDVTSPFYASEYEQLFEMSKRNKNWADFFIPPYYNEQKARIFTFQVAPSLGDDDSFDLYAKKILDKVEKDKEEKNQQHKKKKQDDAWEDDISLKQEEKESKVLIQLLEHLEVLDKILFEINSKRSQYQRG